MLLDKKELDENELDKSELRRKCTRRNVTEPFLLTYAPHTRPAQSRAFIPIA